MYKQILATLVLTAALVIPSVGNAQISSPAILTHSPISCLSLASDLHYGSFDANTAGGVTTLQNFLKMQGYFSYSATGYFGPVTFRAVQQFQLHNGIPGTGYVGPLTRAKIQALSCGVVPPTSTLSITSMTPSSGPIGTIVTLTGYGFTPTTTVKFGTGAITNTNISYINPTRLQFVIPDYMGQYCAPGMYCTALAMQVSPGVYPVAAVDLNTISNAVNFTVTSALTTSAPTINSLSQYSGPVGTTVTAYGSGFDSTTTIALAGSVYASATPKVTSATMLSFTIPSTDTHECFTTPCDPFPLTPGVYSISAHNRYGTGNNVSFTVTAGTNGNISINGIDAPVSLGLNSTGTWTVHAVCTTCAGGVLHYSVDWKDNYLYTGATTSSTATVQTQATFTHAYAHTGTYNPVFTVSDDAGHSATTSASVTVY